MKLMPHEIHIWVADLAMTPEQLNERLKLLSSDELKRAERFRFSIHKNKFIAARGILRIILGKYLNQSPHDISFGYSEFKKPYLLSNPLALEFNLAHSGDIAILGVTLNSALGVDIEKIQHSYPQKIAERYFRPEEYNSLNQLPEDEKTRGFFCIWSKKEAVIKAIGKGLSISLSSFSVSIHDCLEMIKIDHQSWLLTSLTIHPDYQAAVACNQPKKEIKIYQFNKE